MANRLKSNPIYFDDFSADVTLAEFGNPFIVKKIRMKSVADGDYFQLEDVDGNILFKMVQTGANDIVEVDFGVKGFNFGNKSVIIDVSDCTGMAATNGDDAIWIYLE